MTGFDAAINSGEGGNKIRIAEAQGAKQAFSNEFSLADSPKAGEFRSVPTDILPNFAGDTLGTFTPKENISLFSDYATHELGKSPYADDPALGHGRFAQAAFVSSVLAQYGYPELSDPRGMGLAKKLEQHKDFKPVEEFNQSQSAKYLRPGEILIGEKHTGQVGDFKPTTLGIVTEGGKIVMTSSSQRGRIVERPLDSFLKMPSVKKFTAYRPPADRLE